MTATVPIVTATANANKEISPAMLNSGTVALGDTDVFAESDTRDTEPPPALATKTILLPES